LPAGSLKIGAKPRRVDRIIAQLSLRGRLVIVGVLGTRVLVMCVMPGWRTCSIGFRFGTSGSGADLERRRSDLAIFLRCGRGRFGHVKAWRFINGVVVVALSCTACLCRLLRVDDSALNRVNSFSNLAKVPGEFDGIQ